MKNRTTTLAEAPEFPQEVKGWAKYSHLEKYVCSIKSETKPNNGQINL